MTYKVTVRTNGGAVISGDVPADVPDVQKYWDNVYNEYKNTGILRQKEMNNLGLTLIDVKPN